jgi:hypothetical protein
LAIAKLEEQCHQLTTRHRWQQIRPVLQWQLTVIMWCFFNELLIFKMKKLTFSFSDWRQSQIRFRFRLLSNLTSVKMINLINNINICRRYTPALVG